MSHRSETERARHDDGGRRPRGRRIAALALAIAALGWASTLVLVPWLLARRPDALGVRPLAAIAYLSGSLVCHQRPERSFRPWGAQMPVCARCFGLYAPAPVGAALALAAGAGWLGRRRRLTVRHVRALLLVTGLPTAVTWSAEWLGIVTLTPATRFAAALPLGFAVAWVLVAAVGDGIAEIR